MVVVESWFRPMLLHLGQLAIIHGTMKTELNLQILKEF